MMKTLLLQLCALLCIALPVSARHWTDLVDPKALVVTDTGMVKKLVEDDPHYTRTTFRPTGSPTISPVPTQYPTLPRPTQEPTTVPPTVRPTLSPTITANPSTTFGPSGTFGPTITFSPSTLNPTWTPGTGPTGSPSGRYENIEGNGGCMENEVLYEVIMKDQWGDGWDGRNLTIRRLGDEFAIRAAPVNKTEMVAKTATYTDSAGNSYTVTKFVEANVTANETGYVLSEELSPNPVYDTTLTTGLTAGFAYVCLRPTRCYQAEIPGGLWSEEIDWEVRRVSMGGEAMESPLPLAGGGAPTNCTFYVPANDTDFGDASTCPASCSIFLRNAPPEATTPGVSLQAGLAAFLSSGKHGGSIQGTAAPQTVAPQTVAPQSGLSSFLSGMVAAQKAQTSAPTIDSTVVDTAAASIAAESFAGRNAPVTASPITSISTLAGHILASSTVSKSPIASPAFSPVAPAASPASPAAAANPAASPAMTNTPNADTAEMMTSGAMADGTPKPTDPPTKKSTPGPTSVPTINSATLKVSGAMADRTPEPTDTPTKKSTPGPTSVPTINTATLKMSGAMTDKTPKPADPPTDAPTPGPTTSSTINGAALMAFGAMAEKTPKPADSPTKAPTHQRTSAPTTKRDEISTSGLPWDPSFLDLEANPPDVETFTTSSALSDSGTSWNKSSGKAATSEKDDAGESSHRDETNV